MNNYVVERDYKYGLSIRAKEKSSCKYLLAFFFFLVFIFFLWFGNPVLFSQESHSLFIFSGEYLQQYLLKPGGLLEYTGKFLTQFYSHPVIGSLLLAAILTLPGIILLKINKLLIPAALLPSFFLLIPSCLLLMMQIHYYHMMEYSLGFLLVLLFFWLSVLVTRKCNPFISLILFPFIYYLTGAYSWIYMGVYISCNLLYERGMQKYVHCFLLVVIALISLFIFKELLFLQPLEQLIQYPLPMIKGSYHKVASGLLTGYILLFPLWGKIIFLNSIKKLNKKPVSLIFSLILLFTTVAFVSKFYNPQTARVLQMEKLIYEEKWEEAIVFHENYPSLNLIGQYFYNIALSETDQLCERLFQGRQDFNANALILPWKNEYLNWGAYFFYSVGLINEAHRWAYEEMIVYGSRPQNIKLLVKTNLINGNYEQAQKYIDLLKRTINYKRWAKEYERLLADTMLIHSHPELSKKRELIPGENFFIRITSPQNNIPLLLKSKPNNKKAFEYQMAWFLLTKDVTAIIDNIGQMKNMQYRRIPRHMEEAILAYYNSTGKMPDLLGLMIDKKTVENFKQYVSTFKTYRDTPPLLQQKLKERFGNTFWFYFHFN